MLRQTAENKNNHRTGWTVMLAVDRSDRCGLGKVRMDTTILLSETFAQCQTSVGACELGKVTKDRLSHLDSGQHANLMITRIMSRWFQSSECLTAYCLGFIDYSSLVCHLTCMHPVVLCSYKYIIQASQLPGRIGRKFLLGLTE